MVSQGRKNVVFFGAGITAVRLPLTASVTLDISDGEISASYISLNVAMISRGSCLWRRGIKSDCLLRFEGVLRPGGVFSSIFPSLQSRVFDE